MTRRFVSVLPLLLAATLAGAARPRAIGPGETVRATMLEGDPFTTAVAFELTATEAGFLTIDAKSFDFDVRLEIYRPDENGTLVLWRDCPKYGLGSDARLPIEVDAGARYRIEVRPEGQDWGGGFELSVMPGRVNPPDWKSQQENAPLYWDAVELKGKERGERALEARALAGRGALLFDAAAYPEAIDKLREALAIAETRFGAEHSNLALFLSNLATALRATGAGNEARRLDERVLDIRTRDLARSEKRLGPESLELVPSLEALATAQKAVGRDDDARKTLERALSIREARLDPDHPDVARSLVKLAELLIGTREFRKAGEAQPLAARALAIFENRFGRDDLWVAWAANQLGSALWKQGLGADATAPFTRSQAVYEHQLGPEHPQVAVGANNLALIAAKEGRYDDAIALFRRAVALNEKYSGPESSGLASALGNLGQVFRRKGSLAEARPLLERALAIRERREGVKSAGYSESLTSLSLLLHALGSYDEERALLETALSKQEKQLGADDPALRVILQTLAGFYSGRGDFANVRTQIERSMAITVKAFGPDHLDVATDVTNLAYASKLLGAPAAEVRSLYERAVAITEKNRGPDHPDVANSLISLAFYLDEIGAYSEAESLLERALATFQKALGPDHPQTGQASRLLAYHYSKGGDFARAKPLLERDVAILEKQSGADNTGYAIAIRMLADVLSDMGLFDEARILLDRSLAINERQLGSDGVEVDLLAVGQLEYKRGDYAAAMSFLERAAAIAEKGKGANVVELNYLARTHQALGEFAEAKTLFERSLAESEKEGSFSSAAIPFTLAYFGSLHIAMRNWAEARVVLERSLAIREKTFGPDSPRVADVLQQLAVVYAALGEKAKALDAALRAEAMGSEQLRAAARFLAERRALQLASVRTSGLGIALSLAAEGLGDIPGARGRVFEVLVGSRAIVLDEIAGRRRRAADAGYRVAEVSRLARDLALAGERYANLLVRDLGKDSPEIFRRKVDDARKEKERAEEALAQATGGKLMGAAPPAGIEEIRRAMSDGSALVAFARYEFMSAVADRKSGEGGSPSSAPSAPRTASYIAFVVKKGDKAPAVAPLGDAEAIDELVSRLRALLRQEGAAPGRSPKGSVAAYREAGTALRRAIWDPLLAHLRGVDRVFVVPDGALHLVNIAALPSEGDRYLVEGGRAIHYLSAERDLVALGSPRARGEGLLALGGPAYDETSLFASLSSAGSPTGQAPAASAASAPAPAAEPGDKPVEIAALRPFRGAAPACGNFASIRFTALPATATEAEQVSALWPPDAGSAQAPNVLRLTGAAASESAFKAQAPGRRVLHLATHGFFLGGECSSTLDSARGIGAIVESPPVEKPPAVQGESPLRLSGLAFAGANHREAAGPDEDDGVLTAEEIAALDLSGVDWAVLSACDTGVGDIKAGEGVFGLRRAFQVAGAGTLIASLWAVDDESAREWMSALYEGRLKDKLDTAEAVRQASLTVLERRRAAKQSTHPFHWAAFVAAGEWR